MIILIPEMLGSVENNYEFDMFISEYESNKYPSKKYIFNGDMCSVIYFHTVNSLIKN